VWPLNVGQVYTTLQRLERDGLAAATGSGVAVALGVLAMTVGLIRSEPARDLRTLTRADPGRQRLTREGSLLANGPA
jgi:hypothetical protein